MEPGRITYPTAAGFVPADFHLPGRPACALPRGGGSAHPAEAPSGSSPHGPWPEPLFPYFRRAAAESGLFEELSQANGESEATGWLDGAKTPAASVPGFAWFLAQYRQLVFKIWRRSRRLKAPTVAELLPRCLARLKAEAQGGRSCLRRLAEAGGPQEPRHLVLRLSDREPLRRPEAPGKPGAGRGLGPARPFVAAAPAWGTGGVENLKGAEVEVTDGVYFARARTDPLLAARLRGVPEGAMLRISGARVEGFPRQGCHPLELPENAFLSLGFNSVRPVRSRKMTRPGFQGHALAPHQVAQVREGGGDCPCLELLVLRLFPPVFREYFEEEAGGAGRGAGAYVDRSMEEEEARLAELQATQDRENETDPLSQESERADEGLRGPGGAWNGRRNMAVRVRLAVLAVDARACDALEEEGNPTAGQGPEQGAKEVLGRLLASLALLSLPAEVLTRRLAAEGLDGSLEDAEHALRRGARFRISNVGGPGLACAESAAAPRPRWPIRLFARMTSRWEPLEAHCAGGALARRLQRWPVRLLGTFSGERRATEGEDGVHVEVPQGVGCSAAPPRATLLAPPPIHQPVRVLGGLLPGAEHLVPGQFCDLGGIVLHVAEDFEVRQLPFATRQGKASGATCERQVWVLSEAAPLARLCLISLQALLPPAGSLGWGMAGANVDPEAYLTRSTKRLEGFRVPGLTTGAEEEAAPRTRLATGPLMSCELRNLTFVGWDPLEGVLRFRARCLELQIRELPSPRWAPPLGLVGEAQARLRHLLGLEVPRPLAG